MNQFLEHWLVGEGYQPELYHRLYPNGIRVGVSMTKHVINMVKSRVSKKLKENIVFEALDRGIRVHELSKKYPGLREYAKIKLSGNDKNTILIYYNQKIFLLLSENEKDESGEVPRHTFITCLNIPFEYKKEFQRAWRELRIEPGL